MAFIGQIWAPVIVNSAGRVRVQFGLIDLMGSLPPQWLMGSYMASTSIGSDKLIISFQPSLLGAQVHLLIFLTVLQVLHQDVVVAAPSTRPADLDLSVLKPCHEVTGVN